MIGFTGTKDRNLCYAIPVGNIILNEHLSEPVCWSQGVNISIVVIRANLGDDGHLAGSVNGFTFPIAPFNDGQPQSEMDFGIAGQACATVGGGDGWDWNVDRTNGIDGVGPVHAHTSIDVLIIVDKVGAVPRFGVDIVLRRFDVFGCFLTKTSGEHAGREEQHHQHGFEVHVVDRCKGLL